MARLVDPMRRSLPVSEWPEQDWAAWAAATRSTDFLEDGGRAAHWAARTKLTNIQHYGRWLGYLQWSGRLDETGAPADRITREQVREYLCHLEGIVSPYTRLSMLVGLKVMIQAMAPDRDWRWLQDICNRIQATAKPATDKRLRMRPTPAIFAAAIGELRRLPADPLSIKEAILYRDALMLALLAARPLRVKNFAALELGRHLVKAGQNWLLSIPAAETKTRQPLSFHLPEALLPWFERYLASVRPNFPTANASPRLWLGKDGVLKSQQVVGSRITKLTQRLFGKPINPHLLRDCAASSLATVSSDLARAAMPLLGHRSFSTTERYYIQADNLEASRRLNRILRSARMALV